MPAKNLFVRFSYLTLVIVYGLYLSPLLVLAQAPPPPPPPPPSTNSNNNLPEISAVSGSGCTTDLCDILLSVFNLLNGIIVLLMVIATVVFLWGIIKYLRAGGEEENIAEARRLIIWGIIFLTVMVAVWGVVNLLVDFFFHTDTESLLEGDGAIPPGPRQNLFP